jgi:hypothetical protein
MALSEAFIAEIVSGKKPARGADGGGLSGSRKERLPAVEASVRAGARGEAA